jgi:hypothetical protein
MLTDEKWALIDEKYGMLLAKICYKINGDGATCSFDDNLQDLRIAVIEAVKGFEKQGDGANGSFEEFWGTKGFDKYIKTCLWNYKNNKGANVTKKLKLYKKLVSISNNPEVLDLEGLDSSYAENMAFVNEITHGMNPIQTKIVKVVSRDHKFIKANGKLNVSKLAKKLGVSRYDIESHIQDMKEIIPN